MWTRTSRLWPCSCRHTWCTVTRAPAAGAGPLPLFLTAERADFGDLLRRQLARDLAVREFLGVDLVLDVVHDLRVRERGDVANLRVHAFWNQAAGSGGAGRSCRDAAAGGGSGVHPAGMAGFAVGSYAGDSCGVDQSPILTQVKARLRSRPNQAQKSYAALDARSMAEFACLRELGVSLVDKGEGLVNHCAIRANGW